MTENIVTETAAPTATIDQPTPAPAAAPAPTGPVHGYWWGTGRRKTSIARVRIKSGSGKITVNDREMEQYFSEERDRKAVRAPLIATQYLDRLDVAVSVSGGGFAGQAGATKLGIARALKRMDAGLETVLREGGYLTRDARMVERKKYGKAGARRSFQFSKR